VNSHFVHSSVLDLLQVKLRLATDQDVASLRALVNASYRELADLGLNFTGTYQDEDITCERMQDAEVYLAFQDENLVASISLKHQLITAPDQFCLFIQQLAVHPDYKKQGIGSALLQFAQERAIKLGLHRLRLDTAIPAEHLVRLYRKHKFEIIEEVQWPGKTYRSYILEKLI
jgi:GNAT superfamily N-acetyltransferase